MLRNTGPVTWRVGEQGPDVFVAVAFLPGAVELLIDDQRAELLL